MEKQNLRRADLLFSLFLMIFSAFFFYQSVKLFFNPFGRAFEKVNAEDIKNGILEWYKSPALLPLLLSATIFILAILLLHYAIRDGARLDFFKKEKFVDILKNKEFKAVIIITMLLCGYVFVLIPICRDYLDFFPTIQGFPFFIATFIFMFTFIVTFNKKSIGKIITSLLVALIASASITFAFGNLVLIPLP